LEILAVSQLQKHSDPVSLANLHVMDGLFCEVMDDDYVNVSVDVEEAQSRNDNTCKSSLLSRE
jgi:hypothetical protein